MGLSIRFYLFSEDGLQAISQRVMMGLIRGTDAMPQYAGTKQRVADVILESEGKKPVRIERTQGSYLTFDENGQVHKDLVASGFAALETSMALDKALGKQQTKIVDLTPKLNREKWERENRWTLSKDDLEAIADDIWRRKRAGQPSVVRAKGSAPKPPKMTWEAEEALKEISQSLMTIDNKLRWLNEPALKAVAYKAREFAKIEADRAMWLGVAEAADRCREILVRRRTGRGVWYATIQILRWDPPRRTAETVASFHERHNSMAEAEEAARRMLAEHAKHFYSDISVEAELVCELEWDQDNEARLL